MAILKCSCGSRIATPSGMGGFHATCGECGEKHWVPPPGGGGPPPSSEGGLSTGVVRVVLLAVIAIAIIVGWWVTHR